MLAGQPESGPTPELSITWTPCSPFSPAAAPRRQKPKNTPSAAALPCPPQT